MKKICIIKLGADGDVLRTIPLAKAIYEHHQKAEITWITRASIAEMLRGAPYISQISILPEIPKENFDIIYNFDIEKAAADVALSLSAKEKYGFSFSDGYPMAFNPGAEYYLNTIFDDELKKTNKRTYQEMMFEAAELPYKKERYDLPLDADDLAYAESFLKNNNIKERNLVGIHMGAASRWPSKAWHESRVIEFIELASKKGYGVLLFGGPNEAEKHAKLAALCSSKNIKIYRNDPMNTKRQFASLVSLCDSIVCSDSFALHVSIGLGKRTICLFFCTPPDEVEGYGLLTKIVSPKLHEFFPEKMDQYDESLVQSISAEEVMASLESKNNNK